MVGNPVLKVDCTRRLLLNLKLNRHIPMTRRQPSLHLTARVTGRIKPFNMLHAPALKQTVVHLQFLNFSVRSTLRLDLAILLKLFVFRNTNFFLVPFEKFSNFLKFLVILVAYILKDLVVSLSGLFLVFYVDRLGFLWNL